LRAANGFGRTNRDREPSKCVIAPSAEGDAGQQPRLASASVEQNCAYAAGLRAAGHFNREAFSLRLLLLFLSTSGHGR
jgi:hypothetical protein